MTITKKKIIIGGAILIAVTGAGAAQMNNQQPAKKTNDAPVAQIYPQTSPTVIPQPVSTPTTQPAPASVPTPSSVTPKVPAQPAAILNASSSDNQQQYSFTADKPWTLTFHYSCTVFFSQPLSVNIMKSTDSSNTNSFVIPAPTEEKPAGSFTMTSKDYGMFYLSGPNSCDWTISITTN